MSLAKFAVNRKITVLMLSILVVILGSVVFFSLGLDMMPDIDFPIISIITSYRGASSNDIEETITKPIEMSIASVKNVKKVNSESSEGRSIISVEFEWGTDLDASGQDIRDAVERIIGFLPADADRPMVMKFNFSDMPILMYGVTGGENTIHLRKIIEDDVETRLKQLKGVASVFSMSSDEREIQVVVDKMKLDHYNLSINQIANMIRAQNSNIPAGKIDQRQNEEVLKKVFFNNWSMIFFKISQDDIETPSELIKSIKEQMYDNISSGYSMHPTNANYLMRILPLGLMHKLMNRIMKGTGGSFSFSFIKDSVYEHDTFMDSRILNIYHIPNIPIQPGIGLFFSSFGGKINAVLSFIESILSDSEIDLIEKNINSLKND